MIKRIVSAGIGMLGVNFYLVENTNGDAIMIDCPKQGDYVERTIERNGLNIKAILITHGHVDHIEGIKTFDNRLIDRFIGKGDLEFLNDKHLNLSDIFNVGLPEIKNVIPLDEGEYNIAGFDVKVINTPGHTRGSVCYLIEDCLFTGDTVFHHGYGRTDFPTGDINQLEKSIIKILELDENIKVYPGHDESSTIGEERLFYKDVL